MRAPTLFFTAVLACSAAWAQSPAETATAAPSDTPASASDSAPSRYNQRVERIREEDGGSRIDELRVGGQTQSINVQPKVGNVPAYEVKPSNAAREGIPQSGSSDGTNGRRVWNIKF